MPHGRAVNFVGRKLTKDQIRQQFQCNAIREIERHILRPLFSFEKTESLVDISVNQYYLSPQPVPPKGRFAIVTERGAGCDGRCGVRRASVCRTKTPQRTAKSCGPGAATLALRRREVALTTGARKAASPGRARISRQTIARGRPGCPGCTCQIRVRSLTTHCTRCCGRSRRPAFPAPSAVQRDNELASPGRKRAAGMRTSRHSGASEARARNP